MATAAWPRILHILLAIQLLPLTALLLCRAQILGLAFVPAGFSAAAAAAVLRLRARGEQYLDETFFHPAVLRVLDAAVAVGLLLVLVVAAVLSRWAGDIGFDVVYTAFLMILSLALHSFLAIRGYWHGTADEAGYAPLPKAGKVGKV